MLIADVSEFQSSGSPHWVPSANLREIKARNGGAIIIRAGYGMFHPDPTFWSLRVQCAELGFTTVGIYHYLVAGQDSKAQGAWFASHVKGLAPWEVPALDLEEGAGNQEPRAANWFGQVDGGLGLAHLPLEKRSWLYSGLSYAGSHGLAGIFRSNRHTWVAAYGSQEPSLPHRLWQSTDGRIGSNITSWPGIGRCDTSVFHGGPKELASLIDRGDAQPVPVPVHKPVQQWQEKIMRSLPEIHPGRRGAMVKRVQALAHAAGRPVAIDGIYGPDSVSAVKAIQHRAGLAKDGVVGPKTWAVLVTGEK